MIIILYASVTHCSSNIPEAKRQNKETWMTVKITILKNKLNSWRLRHRDCGRVNVRVYIRPATKQSPAISYVQCVVYLR